MKKYLNFFHDEIIIPGISNLEDVAGRPCNLIFRSSPSIMVGEGDNCFNIGFRIGIVEKVVPLSFTPRNEMGINLTLDEGISFCEALYNVSRQNCRTMDRVEIEFSGDNNTKRFGEPISYVNSSKALYRREALTITIEPAISIEGVVKISLQSQVEEKFCSAVLCDKDALLVSYMLRCSCLVATHSKWEAEEKGF
jgi:hypothetical protein